LLPGWWSIALASPRHIQFGLLALFWIGAVAMRGAGCTLNDIIDRKIDARVERTRLRPLPAGEVTVLQAVIFMGMLSTVGAAVLFSLDRLAILMGFAVLLIVATYPFMKRITFWPQLFLGLNFNWGALMGWAAVTGRLQWPALALYLGGIAWTLGYDTIYAHQDARDDVDAGVKSTALRFGAESKIWIAGFFGATIVGIGTALALTDSGLLSYLALALAALHFGWQLIDWRPESQADCLAKFKANRISGLLIFAACILSSY
jgi:4-hydroxybenzoate polyprenyltransferase